jgi:tetratricopeptide (TPR) repeat protein
LEAALDPKAPEPRVLQELGRLYYEDKEYKRAAETFELGRKAEPLKTKWPEELLRVYTQTNDKDRQIQLLKELVPHNPDDLDLRKRLAKLLDDAGRHAEAERYARQALEIDVLDKDARGVLFRSLAAQKKDAEAKALRELFEQ